MFTSNVDGQFQQAGWDSDRIVECHGSIHFLQCLVRCSDAIWPADDVTVEVDAETCRAKGELPTCPGCGLLARPNVLMFGDAGWLPGRTDDQERRYAAWRNGLPREALTAVELGAGTAIATVRRECERRADRLVRINPRDAAVPAGGVALKCGALDALDRLDAALRELERV
ncbi:NAD-dependent protein deacetylase [Alienimonas californiensis]|uniref:protein acetyllysine N-acetyltransferase n=1 Tax=Alienimonas californiensis TaxID=2527989 RepID=A0A517P4E6_9PLAN|nr:NAD-dependent protein deacetylase [Alienimonas californiensis]